MKKAIRQEKARAAAREVVDDAIKRVAQSRRESFARCRRMNSQWDERANRERQVDAVGGTA